tara:strand:- start:113 stop:619 length:507 start_codon:yes stop_codon:yes gene_type:complete
MKFVIPIIYLFASLSYSSNSKEGLDTTDLLFEDSYLSCGSREFRFKSFEIGRSGNVKAKSGLFNNYKITRKGDSYFLDEVEYTEYTEEQNDGNTLVTSERTFENQNGILVFKEIIKSSVEEKIIKASYFKIDLAKLFFKRTTRNYLDGILQEDNINKISGLSGKCKKI